MDDKKYKQLERLSRLQIEDPEQFMKKLWSVISYVESIQKIDLSEVKVETLHTLHPLDTVTPAGEKNLLSNVQHEKVNHSIVVQSVLHTTRSEE